MYPHFNPLRGARGSATITPTNFAAGALFNNDTARLLRVWVSDVEPNSHPRYLYSGTRLTNQAQGSITSIVTGQGVPPGLIDTDDLAAVPTVYDFVAFSNEPPFGQGNGFPFAVLRQGQSLRIVADGSATQTFFSFLWDWVYPAELIDPNIGDPAIDRRARP